MNINEAASALSDYCRVAIRNELSEGRRVSAIHKWFSTDSLAAEILKKVYEQGRKDASNGVIK